MTVCGTCLQTPPPFECTMAAFDYRFPWDRLITRLKFAPDLSLLPALADRLSEHLHRDHRIDAGRIDLVLPMPLAAGRLRERGFNQAWEVARRVARDLGLQSDPDALLRWRDTPHQIGLHHDERTANLRGAFLIAPGARHRLQGRRVALVDDVMTTGASASEACRCLLDGGTSSVQLWVLARTPAAPDR